MRFLLILFLTLPLHGKTIELRFPGLAFPIQLSLPDNFDPTKKHPAILYYHGTNGRPDTALIRRQTGNQDWIVVGMSYYQKGQLQLAPETFKKEVTLYHSIRNYLLTKYSLDPKRLFVSGFSKGGWMSDLLLQQEPTLAGGAILGAGHLRLAARPQKRYTIKKPIYIGVGRLDGNYPFSLKALLHHRTLGGKPILETWPDLAHQLPQAGSIGLRQFLLIQQNPADLQTAAQAEIEAALKKATTLPPLEQWDRLRQLKELPFTKHLGTPLTTNIETQITELEKTAPIKAEAAALKQHRRILAKEITGTSLKSLQEANFAYLDLSDRLKTTRQAKLLLHDHQRTNTLLLHFKEQKKKAPTKSSPIQVPDSPSNRGDGFPLNPLIR